MMTLVINNILNDISGKNIVEETENSCNKNRNNDNSHSKDYRLPDGWPGNMLHFDTGFFEIGDEAHIIGNILAD
jgi:hypothetical protein